MTQIVEGSNKEQIPAHRWGVIKWQTPDGMTAEKAQIIMRAYVVYTHGEVALSRVLNVPYDAVRIYLKRADSIPKHVAWKIPLLMAKLKNAHGYALDILEIASKYSPEKEEVKIQTVREINSEAAKKAATMLYRARAKKGISSEDMAAQIGISRCALTDRERVGVTPKSKGFFKWCEALGVRPELMGFAGALGGVVAKWRRQNRRRLAKR